MSTEAETDPRLLEILKTAGDEWGALGVALAAAAFTDPEVLIVRLRAAVGTPAEAADASVPDPADLRAVVDGLADMPMSVFTPEAFAAWCRVRAALGCDERPAAESEDGEPLPEGEYARVEILGHDSHTGWVTDSTRAGAPVMVIRDWDGHVIAEIPGTSLYRYVPLATPLKRPVTRAMLPPSRGGFDPEHEFADDYYEYGHDEDLDEGDDDD